MMKTLEASLQLHIQNISEDMYIHSSLHNILFRIDIGKRFNNFENDMDNLEINLDTLEEYAKIEE